MKKPIHIGLIMQGGTGWMGGSEYIKNLAYALSTVGRAHQGSVEVSLITGQALEQNAEAMGVRQIIQLPSTSRGFLNRLARTGNRNLGRVVRQEAIDFLYPLTYDNSYNIGVSLPLGSGLLPARWAGWIPDFQHKQLPQLFSQKEIDKRDSGIAALGKDARLILFSSESAARDFKTYCPDAPARAEVLRFCTAPTPASGDPVAVQARYHLPGRFFLISNQLWQHKNHLLVIDALGLLAERGIHPYVVCTGHPGDFRDKNFINVVLQRIHERGVASQVALLGLIDRADQVQLMRRSVAVVQPSLCEGWSTVVEDARMLGKNTVLSDLEVHCEQNPPGAVYFERESAASLAEALGQCWAEGKPGPDLARESAARAAAIDSQAAFGERFVEIVRAAL